LDQFTRRIVGFGVRRGHVDTPALCRMFRQGTRRQSVPRYDNDPLYRFHQWQAGLRVLDVAEIKTVPGVPWSHPFIVHSGLARTWKRGWAISGIITMAIERMQG